MSDVLTPPDLRLPDRELSRRRAHLLTELRGETREPRSTGAAEVQPRIVRRRLSMKRWKRVIPVASAAAVVIVLVLIASARQTQTRLTLVDQALAAIGGGPTIHVVLGMPDAAELVDLKTGKTRELSGRQEFWTDPKLGTIYTRTLDGRITERLVLPRASWGFAAAQWRPFVTGYRNRLEHGSFHVVSKSRIDGKSVEWIAGKATPLRDGGTIVQEIAISTVSYLPLYVRYSHNGTPVPGSSAQIIVAESTARQPALFRRVKAMGEFGGGQTSYGGTSTGIATTITAARAAMQPDPIIPATTINGQRRTWIGLPDYLLQPANSYRDQVNGLTLYYGNLDGYGYPTYTGRYISINELPSRHDANAIWGRGFFRPNAAIIIASHPDKEAIATVKAHGLYIAIQASSKRAAAAAVRALRP